MSEVPEPIAEFFAYVRRRRRLMAAAGTLALACGCIGMVAFGGSATPWLAVVALLGGLLVLGSRSGSAMLREARVLAAGSAQSLELMSWPYRGFRSPVTNRLLITVDAVGSRDRTPRAEFTAVWASPHGGTAPARPASVYGSLGKGRTVIAVDDAGRCYVGRVTRSRPTAMAGDVSDAADE